MTAFFQLFANILAWFYSLVPNYAVAIILLTLLVMVIVTPLTLKGTRSMMVMQQLQPEMRKIQQKYKDDRQKQNEELLKFYKEHDINPIGGCLPLLVQAPVFIVLYQVLRGLTLRQPSLGFATGWVSGQLDIGATIDKIPTVERTFDPAYVSHDSDLYQSLSNTTHMSAFGIDLSESASQALSQGVLHALPYFVLIAIVAVTGFYQQRQIQGRNPNAQVNPQQQMIMRLLPIFLPVISFTLPAGLVLYFAVSNLYRIGQQAFISRSIYGMSRHEQRQNRRQMKDAAKSADAKGNGAKGKPSGDGQAVEESKSTKSERKAPAKAGTKQSTSGSGGAKGTTNRRAKVNTSNSQKAGRGQKPGRAQKAGTSGRSRRPPGDGAATPTLQPRARKKKR
jgi:YidC/Oxa1 family membrane protein insertase